MIILTKDYLPKIPGLLGFKPILRQYSQNKWKKNKSYKIKIHRYLCFLYGPHSFFFRRRFLQFKKKILTIKYKQIIIIQGYMIVYLILLGSSHPLILEENGR